jgi:hypothetical protein
MEGVKGVLSVHAKLTGDMTAKTANSTLGIRVDYRNQSGAYGRSVLYRYGPVAGSSSAEFPWGTKAAPSKTIDIADMSSFKIDVKSEAPEDWDGRVVISFQMQDCGNGTEAKFMLQ